MVLDPMQAVEGGDAVVGSTARNEKITVADEIWIVRRFE